jgi:hypothetical protein
MKTTAVLVATLLLAASAAEGARASGVSEPVLALQYDFYGVEGAAVTDGSGHGLHGRLEGGQIVPGKTKPAVKLEGHGQITLTKASPDLDPSQRALTVGAMLKPAAEDGVIVSMGDATDGFSLYLRAGIPHFAVRASGALHTVDAVDPVDLNQWTHIAGVIDPDGELTLLVNASPEGTSHGALIGHLPADTLSVGADPGSVVGEYSGPMNWRGLVADVRLYWGALSREQDLELLGDWADRPGCGIRH